MGRSETISWASGSDCRYLFGRIRSAPAIAAANGSPQALTWNIGTTASTRSRELSRFASGPITTVECIAVERCEYSTPLGLPVVPLV